MPTLSEHSSPLVGLKFYDLLDKARFVGMPIKAICGTCIAIV